MAKPLKATIEISAVDQASQVVKKIGKEFDVFGKQLEKTKSRVGSVFSGVGAAGLGALGGGIGLGAIVGQAGEFEHALYQTTKVTTDSTESIKQSIKQLPAELGSFADLTQGYYQTMSAGVTDAALATDTLTTAAKLSAVAGTTQGESIQALTKMMAGYRGEIDKVSTAADLLLDIEQLGQTSVKDLIPLMGDLAGMSQTLGVNYKEMAAAMSLLTQTTGSPSQAATQLRELEAALISPTKNMKELFASLHYANGPEMMKQNGLVGTFTLIQQAAKKSNMEISDFIGGQNALLAFSHLAAGNFGKYNEMLAQVGINAGRTDESFKKFMETFKGIEAAGMASFKNLSSIVGDVFLPNVKDGLTEFNTYIANNTEQIQNLAIETQAGLSGIKDNVGSVIDLWKSLPDDITGPAGYGIVGGILFGKTGVVLGLAVSVANAVQNSIAGARAVANGQITFGEYATANKQELEELLNRKDPVAEAQEKQTQEWNDYVKRAHAGFTDYDETSFRNVNMRRTSTVPTPKQQSSMPTLPKNFKPIGAKSGGAGKAESARVSIANLREEIALLTGEGSKADLTLSKKNFEIEKLGKSANLSAPEIANLKQEFNAAFATDTLRKFDDELLKISGNTSAIQAAEMARDIEKWTLQLNALVDAGQLSQQAAAQRLAEYKVNLEKQVDFKDAQAASQFMRELNEISGDYNMGKEEALKLLDLEAEMYRQKLPAAMHGYIGQWKELKRLQTSRDAMDGLERGFRKYTDEATNAAKETERIAYDMSRGMEDGMVGMLDVISGKSKSVMDSLRGMFDSFLSDLFRMAIARPITVSIVGAVSGALGGGATQAQAGTGAGGMDALGLVSNASSLSSMWDTVSGWFGGGATATASAAGIGTAGYAGGLSGGAFLGSSAGSGGMMSGWSSGMLDGLTVGSDGFATLAPSAASGSSFSSILGAFAAPAMGAGIGGMVSPYLNSLLGIQNNAGASTGSLIGGLGATGILGGLAAANIWNPGGWVLGGIAGLASLFGGAAGGLLGGYKNEPGLYAGTWLDLSKSRSGAEMESQFKDTKHPWSWYTHGQDTGYLVQSRHRDGMSKEAAEQAVAYMEGIAKQALGMSDAIFTGMENINKDLAASFKGALSGDAILYMGQDWEGEEPDLESLGTRILQETQNKLYRALISTDISALMNASDGAIADTADEIVDTVTSGISLLAMASAIGDKGGDYVSEMGKKLGASYASAGIDIGSYLSVDFNSLTVGMVESLSAAVGTIQAMQGAIQQLENPLSSIEEQAAASKKQLDDYAKILEKSGLNQQWAASVIEDYRKAVVDDYIKKLNEQISPAAELSRSLTHVADSVTQTIAAMKLMAATQDELAQIENQRYRILQKAYDAAMLGYNQDYANRYAAVTGGDTDSVASIIARENELAKIEAQFGKGTDYTLTLLQKTASLNTQGFKGRVDWTVDDLKKEIADAGMTVGEWYEKYGKAEGFTGGKDIYAQTEALHKAEEARRQLEALQAKQNQYLQQQVNLSQNLVNAWQGVVDALDDTRAALHRENTDPARGFASTMAEFDALYTKARGGDAQAAQQMGQIASELLSMGKGMSVDQDAYQALFNDIDKKLLDTSTYAGQQFDIAQAQLDAMNAQLGAQEAGNDLSAQILAAQQTLNAALAGLAAPKPEYTPDAKPQTPQNATDALLKAKAEAMNKDQTLQTGQNAGGWTADLVRAEMAKQGLTPEQWYAKYGKYEGFSPSGGGSTMQTWQQGVLQAKAAALNAKMFEGRKDWNVQSVNKAIADAGLTFTTWYEKFGKAEGFATGGTTVAGVAFEANEFGRREIFMTPIAQGVLSADDSRRTMDSVIAMGRLLHTMPTSTDSSARAEMASLREENRAMRQELQRMTSLLEKVVAHTKGSTDELATMRSEGLQTRAFTPPPMNIIPFPA